MRTNRFLNKALSLLALICLGLMQVMPVSVSAAPVARPAAAIAPNVCAGDTTLNICFEDGNDPAFNDAMSVTSAVTHVKTTELPNDKGGLTANIGDTVHIPFAVADVNPNCATIAPFVANLRLNAQQGPSQRDITTTLTFPSGAGLTYQDGLIGPPGGTDTVYGAFDFVVMATDGVPDTGGFYINFQINTTATQCISAASVSSPLGTKQMNVDGPPVGSNKANNTARRVQVVGANFTLTENGASTPPDHVSLNNSVAIPIKIKNVGSTATFTINTTVAPKKPDGSAVPVQYVNMLFSGVPYKGDGSDSLLSNHSATGNVTVGPIPLGYGQNITITITVIGTTASGSEQQQLVITLPVWQPAIAIALSSDKPLYKPGDTATYTITVTNSGQLTLDTFSILDSLDGQVDLSSFPKSLAPGSSASVSFTHVIKNSDANPLIDTATINAFWTPSLPDIGPQVKVASNTTYQVNVVSANINLTFGPNSPTPNYAQPGKPINGTVVIANTGTQDVNSVVTSVSLVDAADATKIYNTGILAPGVPTTLLAGTSVSPAFSLTLPASVPNTVTSVNLVITLSGKTSQGVVINRTLTQALDVVLSALHVIVTSDAPSGVVARGQVVNYTVKVQNISPAPVTGIHLTALTADSQNLLIGAPLAVPDLAAAGDPAGGDIYTLPASFVKPFTVVGTTTNPLVAIATATFSTTIASGRLSLAISDVQLAINDNALCTVAAVGNDCAAVGSNPIANNQVQPGQIVRFGVLIQNVGQSTVTNVNACQGNTIGCASGDPTFVSLDYGTNGTPGTLFSLGAPATAFYYVTIPANAKSPFVALLTVSVKDQNSLQVLFRASATLQLVSSNAYWTITKTASPANVFVGDTVTYTVKACYNPTAPNPPATLDNVVATDPFVPGNHQVLLQDNGTGTAVSPLPSLAIGHCAQGTYPVVMDDKTLGDATGPLQVTNIVTFSTSTVAAATATQSATINLSNPLRVTKSVNTNTAKAGDPVTYSFTFKNLSPTNTFSGLTASDNLLPDAFKNVVFPNPLGIAGSPTDSFTVNYLTTAAPVNGPGDTKIINTVTANGTINGVADASSAEAKLDVASPLLVTKSVDNAAPYYYDPAITYTVTVSNISSRPVKLDNVDDTLGNKTSPSVNSGITVTVGPTLRSGALSATVLAPGETGTFTYKALPSDIQALAGAPVFTNKVTITGEVGNFAAGKGGSFTTTATATVIIYQPLYLFSACPAFSYYGWGQTSHWHFALANGSDVANPYALSNIAVTVNGLTGISGLNMAPTVLPNPITADFSSRPQSTADFDWTVPWQSPLLTFNDVYFSISYTATQGGKSFDFKYTLGLKEAGCFGYQVGPPLTVTKTPSVANAKVGDTITYTLTIRNPMFDDPKIPPSNGITSGSVTAVTAVDQTFAPGTNLAMSFPSGNQLLKPGQSASLIVPITHVVTGSDPSPLINKVYVTGKLLNVAFPGPVIGTATVILPNPLIVLTLNGNPPNVSPGGTIIYDAVIQNNSLTPIQLTDASTDSTSINGLDPHTGLTNWITTHNNGIIPPGGKITIPGLYQVAANPDPTKTGPFTSTLTLNYTIQTNTPTNGVATASATVNVDNPNLRILLKTSPAIVVTYGQTIVYTETLFNPGTVEDTNLTVNHVLLAPNDAVGNWKDVNGADLGPIIPVAFKLQPGASINRTVTHLVTTIDNSPLTFVVTANGQYMPSCGSPPCAPILVQDRKVSTVTISSAQLLMFANADRLSIAPGDNDNVTLTLTNIGSVAITQLDVTATLTDIKGAVYPVNALPTVVLTTPGIPGSNVPGNQLLPLSATGANYVVQVPKPLPANYPNPLILTFTATGTTAEGLSFKGVTTTLIFHILQPNINIIETPRVAAVPVNGTVTYDVVVTNPGVPDLAVTGVTDNNSNLPISLTFPGQSAPSTTGTLKTNESARGTTTAQVVNLLPNPFVHSSTAVGTTTNGPAVDTFASTVNVLGSGLTATYTASPSQGSVGAATTFTVTVTNTSNITINTLIATDIEHGGGNPITLKDSNGATITSLASNASATGVFMYTPNQAGSFIEHVQITGTDATGSAVAASAAAPFSAIGIGLVFVQPPTPDKPNAKVGDVVTFSFTLKNIATGSNNDLSNISVICVSNANCGTLIPTLATLPADGSTSATETVAYTVQPGDALGTGTVTLTFQATGTQTSAPLNTTTATAIGQFSVTTGGLLLTKTANPTSGKPGDTINYTVTLKNQNVTPLTVLSVTDTLAGSLQLGGATIAAGGTTSATYSYVIPTGAPATITNSVSVTFSLVVGATQTATATANVAVKSPSSGGLTVSVTPSVPAAKVGGAVTYTIAITNSGTTTISSLQATSSLGITTNVSGTITPGQTLYFTTTPYTIPLGATGTVINVITVSGTDSTGAPTAAGSANVVIIGPSGLSVTKTANMNTAKVGQTVTYTIQIANYGTGALTISSVTDSDVSADPTALSSLNNKTVAPGTQAAPIVVTHLIAASDPVTLQDVVTVAALDVSNSNAPISTTASATVINITAGNGLIISAVPNKTVATSGDILTYTVTIANVTSGATAMTITNLAATFGLPSQSTSPISPLLVTSLAPGTQTSATFQYTASALVNPLILKVTATGSDVNNTLYYASSTTPPVTVSAAGALYAASLSADVTNIPPVGSKINFTFTVINTGSSPLTQISAKFNNLTTLSALFDPNLTNVMFNRSAFNRPLPPSDNAFRPVNNLNPVNISPLTPFATLPALLAPGASTSVSFSYTVQPSDGKVALVAAIDLTVNGLTATTFSSTIQPTAASLTVSTPTSTCGAPCMVKPGDSIPLTFTVTNTGSVPLTSLRYTVNNGVVFTPSPATTTLASGAVTLTFNYSVPAALPLINPVALSITVTDTVTNATASSGAFNYTVINPSMSVSISSPVFPAIVADLSTITFNMVVQNTSTPVAGVPLPLTFNSGSSVLNITAAAGGATIATLPITLKDANGAPLSSLAPGANAFGSATYTIKASDPAALSVVFSATGCAVIVNSACTVTVLNAAGGQITVLRGATATPTLAITGTPGVTVCTSTNGLTVTQTASVATVKPGGAVTFKIVVSNGTGAAVTGIALNDTLPTGFTAGSATTDVGSAAVNGNSLTVAIGTLNAASQTGSTATITLPATVGSTTAPASVNNTAAVTVAGVSSSTPCSATATITVISSASVLPVTGFGALGTDSGALGGLLILIMLLSSVLVFGMTINRNGNRGGNNPLLLAGGLLAILVVMLLLAVIGVSLINKARTAPAATGTAAALNPTAIIVTLPGQTYTAPTMTPVGAPPTIAPTLTDVPSNTPMPPPSAVPTAAPPFQPVGEKSFFMPRLQIPGGAVGLPITELPLVNSTWNVNALGHIVGHLEQTSWLGNTGNTVLVAHIQLAYNDYGPFLRLADAQLGDLVYVADHGQFYTFQVVDIKKVNPTDVEVTYPTPNPILTLITCTTWDAQKGAFAQRLVVTAKLIKSPNYTA